MVDWYKHDIPDWMDATEDLDAECYRTYHVLVQLIMVNEKPIRNNERGISGRCRQSLRTYRRVIKELVERQLIAVESGRIANVRASIELKQINENRINAAKGGKASRKSLKNKDADQATLQKKESLLDKTREEKTSGANAPRDPRTRLFNEGLATLAKITGKGPDACRSFVGKCLKAAGDDAVIVLGLIEDAARNQTANPSAWIAARIKSPEFPNGKADRPGSLVDSIKRELDALQGEEDSDSSMYPGHIHRLPP